MESRWLKTLPLICCGLAFSAAQPQEGGAGEPDRLPRWLRVGFSWRGRAEANLSPSDDLDERAYLDRLRLSISLQPARWSRFVVEVQDARIAGAPGAGWRSDSADIRVAMARFGQGEQGWSAVAGRQELSLGDERLLGADSGWDPLGQTFDALRVTYESGSWHGAAFAGYRVEPSPRRPNGHDRNSRLAGVFGGWKDGQERAVVLAYWLCRQTADSADLLGRPGSRNVFTPGIHVKGNLRPNLSYNVEAAVQRGRVGRDRVEAWAGHWAAGWRPLGADVGPALEAEFNFASGDADPGDGRHETFDDLFPAGFNQFGLVDPFAWRNIRYPGLSAEIPLTRRWTLQGGFRSYWLATAQDGLYPGGDAYLARAPDSAGAHVGSMWILSGTYATARGWRVQAGVAHLRPGVFLRHCGRSTGTVAAYLQGEFVFPPPQKAE